MDWSWLLIVLARWSSPSRDDHWALRLAALDTVRAEAFARSDPALLDAVYAPGASAGRADATTLHGYARRGARVTGAELRVLSCRVLSSSSRRVSLDVVDQLRPAWVVWADGTQIALPRDEPSRRIVTLARTSEGWRIAGVRLR